ncbi:MAG: radical SAM family heme chaperone HemW [bacterium]
MANFSIYIHIPFCLARCYYCDFNSFSYHKYKSSVFSYIFSICAELKLYEELFSNKALISERDRKENEEPKTKDKEQILNKIGSIYIGGGTPSCISPGYIEKILDQCQKVTCFDQDVEITLEVNPGTVTKKKLLNYKKIGINRLSLGIQSFNDEILRAIGRIHNSKDSLKAYWLARDCCFDNINMDMIFGLPQQSLSHWEKDVLTAVSLEPEHISTYNLTLEKGSKLYNQIERKELAIPDEEAQLRMYKKVIKILKSANYRHYEISNFAKNFKESQHNLVYWHNLPYIGLGAGAFSYLDDVRYGNEKDITSYINLVKFNKNVRVFEERLSKEKKMGETIMLSLRLIKGISLENFTKRFGIKIEEHYDKVITKLSDDKLINLTKRYMRLSSKGLFFANEVAEAFII